ncbi:testicular haploid expressed gene protein-like [Cimex lectularius]|uniref:Testicular haploid expressed gene protein-like n=1 Tax=Cimex lectularius TaxID=79782 RepID=A0A8I6RCY4_CIMLE|nr:testicular haploid expressed gene protein-like [Cimex lectularius]
MEYKGRPEFNESWGNMTRKIHLQNLAKPSSRRLRPFPDPLYYQPVPPVITKESMVYKPTKRIEMLSTPVESKKVNKYEPEPEEPIVEPAALLFTPTERLAALAKPKQIPKEKRKKKRKDQIKKEKERLKSSLMHRGEWLSKNAAPRKYPREVHKHPTRPRYVFIGTRKIKISEKKTIPKYTVRHPHHSVKVSKEEIMRHMAILAIPSRRREKYVDIIAKQAQEEPKVIPKASGRIIELAQPRQLAPDALLDLKYKPYKVSKGALKYQATERINVLATPITKTKKIDTDVKEDPFGVSKAALKAVCSKRIQELAKPVIKE